MSTPSQSRAVLVAIQHPSCDWGGAGQFTARAHPSGENPRVPGRGPCERKNGVPINMRRSWGRENSPNWHGGPVGPGTIAASFERPMHKAASKREAAESDEAEESEEERIG